MKTIIYTCLALLCFAANSILCRLALGSQSIDPISFTAIRLLSGVVMLSVFFYIAAQKNGVQKSRGSWLSSVALFSYAVAFSLAYTSLDTGTGALVLFGCVQISMIAWHLVTGNRMFIAEWLGLGVAFSGLIYLVYPAISTPSFKGMCLMGIAGVAWAIYTLRGKASTNALADTGYNFLRTTPLVVVLVVANLSDISTSGPGIFYAVLSGAVASGIGYTIWYVALEGLSATEAAVTQLSVPAIAAVGGVLLVGELISVRLAIAGGLILGGILLVIVTRPRIIGEAR